MGSGCHRSTGSYANLYFKWVSVIMRLQCILFHGSLDYCVIHKFNLLSVLFNFTIFVQNDNPQPTARPSHVVVGVLHPRELLRGHQRDGLRFEDFAAVRIHGDESRDDAVVDLYGHPTRPRETSSERLANRTGFGNAGQAKHRQVNKNKRLVIILMTESKSYWTI